MVFFEANTIRDYEKHVGKCHNHDGVPNVEKFAKRHNDEVVDTVVLLGKPELCFYFVVLQSF